VKAFKVMLDIEEISYLCKKRIFNLHKGGE
jgi:hypothetical protein